MRKNLIPARGVRTPGGLVVLALLALAAPLNAQLPAPRPRPRGEPAAGPVRLPDGRPGPGYWQQQVDYRVDATLRPRRHELVGAEWITYHNNSPDTLRELYWHLYQNIFRPLAGPHGRARIVGPVPRPTRGIELLAVETAAGPLPRQVDRTLMRTALPRPLPPGGLLRLYVRWRYEVPSTSPDLRTGRSGADYGMAQWYPQIAVYDQSGWHAEPYLGQGEFYLEYGDWDVRLRLPARYVVAATGTLLNADSVLDPVERQRLARVSPDSVVHVIERVRARGVPRPAAGLRTWHFAARRVRDFVWAASPDYLWDATRTRAADGAPGALVSAYYLPRERHDWSGAAVLARRTMELYASWLGPYVYPRISVVSGPVHGMEYPMLVFGNPGSSLLNEPARVLVHELGHQWFPMMVGSDENRYPLMDEGFVTYLTARAMGVEFGPRSLLNPRLPGWARALAPRGDERLLDQTVYLLAARAGQEIPVLTPSDRIPPDLYAVAAYMKPSAVLYMLGDVVGADTLQRALRTYTARWLFRHPLPQDFFHTVEDVSGRELAWFWDEWFRETWTLDIAIQDVRQTLTPGGWSAVLDLANLGTAVMPATVRLELEDGRARDVRVPGSVWTGVEAFAFTVDSLPARVRSVVVDPDLVLADVDRMNNRWPGPRVTADWRPGLLMDLLPPLNVYRVGLSPSLGYARAAGAQLGLSAAGSYLGTDHRVSLALRVGTRNGRVDGELDYSTPLRTWGPGRSWWADAFRMDGRVGAGLGLEIAPGAWGGLLASRPADMHLDLAVRAIALQDSSYLPADVRWAPGTLVYGSASFRRELRGPAGSGLLAARLEAGAPGSSWNYGLGQLEARADLPLPAAGLHLLARAVAGSASGGVPPQVAFDLAEAPAIARYGSQLFRSRGVLEALSLADNARLGGGGAIPGARTSRLGTRLAALNLALQRGPLELFGDVGDAWSPPAGPRWTTDAGLGVGIDLDLGQGPIHPLDWGVHLLAPLWVDDPAYPGDTGWDLRWRVVFGGRWGG